MLILVEPADRDAVPPFERLLEGLGRLLLDVGGLVDHRVVAFIFELVDTRHRPARRRVLPVLAAVPLLRVQIVVRGARLQDIEEGVALVLDPRFDRGDEMLDVVRITAADPGRAGGEASQIGFTASLMFGWARDFVCTPSFRVGAACPFVNPYTPLSWMMYNMSRFRRPAFTK